MRGEELECWITTFVAPLAISPAGMGGLPSVYPWPAVFLRCNRYEQENIRAAPCEGAAAAMAMFDQTQKYIY